MPSRGSDVSMVRADDGAPWLLGCVVTTKTATCLVNATVRDPPGGPVRVRQLCGMLTALHSLAGGIAEPVSFLALSRFSVGLCESRDGYIVAVLADPGVAHRESVSELARVVARAFARAGGSDLPDLIHADTLDAEERADAHTVHDDLADSSDEPRTWDRFASFHDEFLVPALRDARPPRLRWLEPVAALPDILRVHLLTLEEDETSPNEAPETESPDEPTNATRANATRSTLSLPGAAASHPLAALAGVGATGALWTAVKRHAAALIASAADRNRDRDRTDSASDSEVLAFDDVVGCAGAILRVAMRATPHPGAPRGYAVVAAFSASSPRGGAWGPSHVTAARDASAASAFGSGSGSGSESPSRSGSSTPTRAGDETWRAREAARRAAYPRSYVATRSAAAAPRALAEAFAETRRRVAEDHERRVAEDHERLRRNHERVPRDADDGEGASDSAPIEAPPPIPAREVHAGSPSDRERAAAAAEARARANAAEASSAATPAAKQGFGTPSSVRVAVETPRNADGHGDTNGHAHGNESVEVLALPTARGGAKPPVRPTTRGGDAGDVLAEARPER